MKWRVSAGVLLVLVMVGGVSVRAAEKQATIIYDDKASEVSVAEPQGDPLWISIEDLKRATGFELKPQGACRGELCFPLPKDRRQEFVRKSSGKTWFNLVAFAKLVHQPVAHDEALATWNFGLRGDQSESLTSLRAPDFSLPDMSGKMHALSDFRGKKVLLLTWASW